LFSVEEFLLSKFLQVFFLLHIILLLKIAMGFLCPSLTNHLVLLFHFSRFSTTQFTNWFVLIDDHRTKVELCFPAPFKFYGLPQLLHIRGSSNLIQSKKSQVASYLTRSTKLIESSQKCFPEQKHKTQNMLSGNLS